MSAHDTVNNWPLKLVIVLLVFSAFVAFAEKCEGADYSQVATKTVRVTVDDGSATGVYVGENRVLTAAHVILDEKTGENMKNVFVTFLNGERIKALIRKVDKKLDIALLYLPHAPEGLEGAYLNRKLVDLGEDIFLLGHLSKMGWNITKGYVIHASQTTYIIQAIFGVGMSGCGVYDEKQRLIGIATKFYPPVLVEPKTKTEKHLEFIYGSLAEVVRINVICKAVGC